MLESKAFADWIANTEIFGEKMQGKTTEEKIKDYKAKIRQAYKRAYKGLSEVEQELKSEYEMMANFSGDVLFSGDMTALTKMLGGMKAKQRNAVIDFILDLFRYLKEKLSGNEKITLEIVKLERLFNEAVYDAAQSLKSESETSENQKTTTEKIFGSGDYSFEGYAEDGKGKYKSNFPKGTPKSAKGEKILKYIQEVWSKKPIRLRINENGSIRYIEAKFDPAFDKSGNTLTDASKLMGGNRHGTASEQRVTLDLADDYYQIASESQYNYSKDETGKDNPTHKDVSKWHYFINDIYFAEYDSEEYAPYRVSINVKEKSDGEYVYSFSAEKQEGSTTPQTLHAVVNGDKKSTANGNPSTDSIHPEGETVNNNLSDEGGDYSINLNKTREDALDLLEGKISLDEYVEKQEKINKSRESRIRRTVKSERNKFKGFSGSIIDLERGVREILGISDSTYDKESLKNELGALLSLADRKNINQDIVSIIRASCEQIAQAVVEQSKAWHIRADDSQEMLNEIRGTKIY